MKFPLPQNLTALACALPSPLYVVGGSVRDFLAGFPLPKQPDWDIASPASEEELLEAATACGFTASCVYPQTGTVKLYDKKHVGYEFTRFRSDKYIRGMHAPVQTVFTADIEVDARRRDFCANALYYDIKAEKICDPLGGVQDVQSKILRTVAPAKKVFGEDGLRLMRLARISAATGFTPDEECMAGATANHALIRDIAPERIFCELNLLLHADLKHGDKTAPYRGLCILRDTHVLHEILPELTLGENMPQRSDFHDHDVLEHSLRCVLYAPPEIRFAALLHDVGKPFCKLRDGKFHAHPEEGARIAEEFLTRLKAPKKLTEETVALVKLHMRDYDLQMRESKVRREIVTNFPLFDKLLALKQADFSACKDNLSPAPSVEKWQRILEVMRGEGVPFSIKELCINGDDLLGLGIPPQSVGTLLRECLDFCAQDGARNNRKTLLKFALNKQTT